MSKLKDRRNAKHISQCRLSEISGVNIRMIQYYEQGRSDINKAEALSVYKLAKALECRIEDLLELDEAL